MILRPVGSSKAFREHVSQDELTIRTGRESRGVSSGLFSDSFSEHQIFFFFYHPLVERVWGPHPRWCCNSVYSDKDVGPSALQASAAWHGTRCADSSCSGWLMWEVLARRSWPGPNNRGERTDFRQAVLQFPFCYFCQLSAPSFSSSEQTRQTSVLQGTEYTGQGFCSVTFNLPSIGLPFHVHPPNLHFNKAFKLIAN